MTAADWVAVALLVSLTLYVCLGGADFGGGVWDLFAGGPRAGRQRALIEEAIAPVWEANHVWLILALVLLFTGFPEAFATIAILLHVPLTFLLVGIVLRGAAFVFRQYGSPVPSEEARAARRRWGTIFATSSVLTPIFLGVSVGAVTAGNLPSLASLSPADYFVLWLAPFPLLVGAFTLALFALLAALYLTVEANEPALQDDFRQRALWALVAVIVTGGLCALTLGDSALHFRLRFTGDGASHVMHGLAAGGAWGTYRALRARHYAWARACGVTLAVSVIVGWGYAQYPYLVTPLATIASSAAPEATLRAVLGALGAGSLLLIPSLYWLLRLFKTRA